MKDDKWFYIAVALIYIALSAAIIAGIYITKSAWCLWAFILMPTIKSKGDKEEDDEI